MSEHDLQVTVFDWVERNKNALPELANYFAIPNGGHRWASVGYKMKKEGQKAGILDTFLAIPTKKYHGLFIEHKWGKGKLTPEQKTWISKLENYGYLCKVSRSFEETKETLLRYIDEAI